MEPQNEREKKGKGKRKVKRKKRGRIKAGSAKVERKKIMSF